MKIEIEVDCTPDEARRFLGLPDVSSMQAAFMARIERRMLEAADNFAPDAMLKSWLSVFPQGQERMQEMFGSFFKAAAKATAPPKEPGSGQ